MPERPIDNCGVETSEITTEGLWLADGMVKIFRNDCFVHVELREQRYYIPNILTIDCISVIDGTAESATYLSYNAGKETDIQNVKYTLDKNRVLSIKFYPTPFEDSDCECFEYIVSFHNGVYCLGVVET